MTPESSAPSALTRFGRHISGVIVVMAVIGVAVAANQASPRTVWDAVYTREQAARGETLATAQCVSCHGVGLAGGEAAPALTGDIFNSTWEGVPLSELADRIRTTMPLDKPGSLSRTQTSDLLAYMLALSKMPAGAAALPAETAALGQITYRSYPSR